MVEKPTIPVKELDNRIDQVQKLMVEGEIDALLIPLGVHFQYFFGKTASPSERLIAGIIPDDGSPFILAPHFEKQNIEASTFVEDIVIWEETESPYKLLASELDERKIGENLRADPKIWFGEIEKIQEYSRRSITSTSDLLSSLRSQKSDWEIDQLRKAAEFSSQAIIETLEHLKQGMTELELRDILSNTFLRSSGTPLSFGIVQFGQNSAIPHGSPSTKKLQQDDVVLIDAGTSVNGYHGDITVTTPFGKPKNFVELYNIVFEANRLAFDHDGVGAIPAELDSTARKFIATKGYGDCFTHRLGHGLGLEVHEDPYIVGNNSTPLEIGNTHTIEPGIYQPRKFGIRIEDDVYISKNGVEFLYQTPRYLFQ